MSNNNSSTVTTTNAANSSQNNTSTFQIPPLLSLHFEELKREMSQFGATFSDWVRDKREILTDGKDVFLKTLAEEADAVEGLKKQYAQLQALRQATILKIEQEDSEYAEMVSVNAELREQRNKLSAKLTEMKDKIEFLHAEIGRDGAST